MDRGNGPIGKIGWTILVTMARKSRFSCQDLGGLTGKVNLKSVIYCCWSDSRQKIGLSLSSIFLAQTQLLSPAAPPDAVRRQISVVSQQMASDIKPIKGNRKPKSFTFSISLCLCNVILCHLATMVDATDGLEHLTLRRNRKCKAI